MGYWRDFGLIGLLFILSLLLAAVMVALPSILMRLKVTPSRSNPTKLATYECGPLTIGRAWVQFNFRYYFYALLFLLFDIEVVFLYPWAVIYEKQSLFLLVEMLIFIFILIIGFIYAWKRRALEWK